MPRQRDDYDDEDFDGYNRPRAQDAGGRGRVITTVVGAGILLALIIGMLVLFVLRARKAEHALEKARAVAELKEKLARPKMPTSREQTWPRMVGDWSRTPVEKEDGGYPHRFEFREDLRATTLRGTDGGEPFRQESKVEIVSDNNDTVQLKFHVPMGLYGYKFTLKPNGILVLDNGKGGLEFRRDK